MQVSSDSIYYSEETERFYLCKWEHLRHRLDARMLFYKEDIDIVGYEKTNVIRDRYNQDHSVSMCKYASPLIPTDTLQLHPYNQCLMDYMDAPRKELNKCLADKNADAKHASKTTFSSASNIYKSLIHGAQSNENLADLLSANLLQCIDLYGLMKVVKLVMKNVATVRICKALEDLIGRVVDIHNKDPVIAFEDAYDSWKQIMSGSKKISSMVSA